MIPTLYIDSESFQSTGSTLKVSWIDKWTELTQFARKIKLKYKINPLENELVWDSGPVNNAFF